MTKLCQKLCERHVDRSYRLMFECVRIGTKPNVNNSSSVPHCHISRRISIQDLWSGRSEPPEVAWTDSQRYSQPFVAKPKSDVKATIFIIQYFLWTHRPAYILTFFDAVVSPVRSRRQSQEDAPDTAHGIPSSREHNGIASHAGVDALCVERPLKHKTASNGVSDVTYLYV